MGRKRRQRRKNPSGSCLGWVLAGIGVWLLVRKARGLGDPPTTLPSFPMDEEIIPDSTLAMQFGMTASDIAAAKKTIGPITRERMDTLLQQQQRERAYYEGMTPQKGKAPASSLDRLLRQDAARAGALPAPGQFSIDGVPQPQAAASFSRPALTTFIDTLGLDPKGPKGPLVAPVIGPPVTTPPMVTTPSGPAPSALSILQASFGRGSGPASRGDESDEDTSVSRRTVTEKPPDPTMEALKESAEARKAAAPKTVQAARPSGPSVMRYTDEWGRTTTFDPSKEGGVSLRTISPPGGVTSQAEARYTARTAMEAMAPAKLTPDAARRQALQPIPSWQLDFSVGTDPSGSKQRVAEAAAKKLERDTGAKAAEIAGKYRSAANLKPVDSEGRITAQGKALIALEGMDSDTRAKYVGSVAELGKINEKKAELENEKGWNEQMVTGQAGGEPLKGKELEEFKATTAEQKEKLKQRNKEISKEMDNLNKKMAKPAQIVKDVETVADNLYKAAEVKTQKEAVRGVPEGTASSNGEVEPRGAAAAPTPTPAAMPTPTPTPMPAPTSGPSFEEASKGVQAPAGTAAAAGAAARASLLQQMQMQHAAAAAALPGILAAQAAMAAQMAQQAAAATGAAAGAAAATGGGYTGGVYTRAKKPSTGAPPSGTPYGGAPSSGSDDYASQPSIQRIASSGGKSSSPSAAQSGSGFWSSVKSAASMPSFGSSGGSAVASSEPYSNRFGGGTVTGPAGYREFLDSEKAAVSQSVAKQTRSQTSSALKAYAPSSRPSGTSGGPSGGTSGSAISAKSARSIYAALSGLFEIETV